MSFLLGQTKLSVISGCPYKAGVRRAGFHCNYKTSRYELRYVLNYLLGTTSAIFSNILKS